MYIAASFSTFSIRSPACCFGFEDHHSVDSVSSVFSVIVLLQQEGPAEGAEEASPPLDPHRRKHGDGRGLAATAATRGDKGTASRAAARCPAERAEGAPPPLDQRAAEGLVGAREGVDAVPGIDGDGVTTMTAGTEGGSAVTCFLRLRFIAGEGRRRPRERSRRALPCPWMGPHRRRALPYP
jgi:hypothetical protein